MSDIVVVNRRDFYEFCAALNQFPDWAKVQDWIAANEITAPPAMPTVDDVVVAAGDRQAELVDRLDSIIATLRELRPHVEKAAAIGDVFDQFGAMMGVGPPSVPSGGPGTYVPNVGAVNVLSQAGGA